MEAIALILTKFSDELIAAQLAVLLFTSAVAGYWLLVRKKKKESAEWVSAALVRAYLDRVKAEEAEIRLKLFGESSGQVAATVSVAAAAYSHAPLNAALTGGADPALLKEIEALRSQLTLSDQKAMEFDRTMNALKAEKSALEQKLKEAAAAPAAGAAVAVATGEVAEAVKKELDDLRAKLQEYEVIEDDLANLKKFQKENEQLRQKVEQYEKGGAPAAAVVGGAAAEPAAKMVISGGAENTGPAMTVIPGGASASAPVETVIPADTAAKAETPAAPETNTNVLQPVTPTLEDAKPAAVAAAAPAAAQEAAAAPAPEAPAAPEKSSQQKEEELLSEFEKMLAS